MRLMSAQQSSRLRFVALALASASCGGGSEPSGNVASIVATPNPLTIPQLSLATLEVTLRDADGDVVEGPHITFESGDPSLVTVNAAGVVAAPGPVGTTKIVVTAGDARLEVPATVTLVQNLVIGNAKPIVFASDSSVQIVPLLSYAYGQPPPGVTFGYSVEPASLFVISPDGMLSAATPAATGFGTVTAAHGSLTASAAVAVASASALRTTDVDANPYGLIVTPDGAIHGTGVGGHYLRGSVDDETVSAVSLPGSDMVTIIPGVTLSSVWIVGTPAGSISEISTVTGEALGSVTGLDGTPLAIALVDDGTRLLAGTAAGYLYVIDAATKGILKTYNLGGAIANLAAHPSLPVVYASHPDISRVLEFDLDQERVTRTILLNGRASGLALRGSTTLLVANTANRISEITLSTGAITDHTLPCTPFRIALSADETRLAISCAEHHVLLADLPEMQLRAMHRPGSYPRGIAFTPDGARAVVANESGWVNFVDFP